MKPYGYVRKDGEGLFIYGEHQFQNAMGAELVPVYLHPKEWVGLTDEEVTWLCNTAKSHEQTWGMFVRTIEAKLKEKNT
jgi:hypothetical protein